MTSLIFFIDKHIHLILLVILFFILCIIFIYSFHRNKKKERLPASIRSSDFSSPLMDHAIPQADFKAIAGEDILLTKLDAARAFIEIGKKTLAAEMLNQVLQEGTASQKEEAFKLRARL